MYFAFLQSIPFDMFFFVIGSANKSVKQIEKEVAHKP